MQPRRPALILMSARYNIIHWVEFNFRLKLKPNLYCLVRRGRLRSDFREFRTHNFRSLEEEKSPGSRSTTLIYIDRAFRPVVRHSANLNCSLHRPIKQTVPKWSDKYNPASNPRLLVGETIYPKCRA